MLALCPTLLAPALPLSDGWLADPGGLGSRHERILSVPAKQLEGNCSSYVSVTGNVDDTAWCTANCERENCPEEKCKCAPEVGGIQASPSPGPQTRSEADQRDRRSLAVPVKQLQAPCSNYAGISGDDVETAWCTANCALGNCPEDRCMCADAGAQAAAQAVPQAAPAPELPQGAAQQEAKPAAAVAKVQVDQDGEKGLPFEHALIGYWGAGPFTPFDDGTGHPEEGPSVADALKQGYNVICVSFGDQFTLDGDFQIDTDLCPGNREMVWRDRYHPCTKDKLNITKEAGMPIDSWRYILSFGGAAGPGPYMPKATSPEEREEIENKFVDGFVARYAEIKKEYGFDGIGTHTSSPLPVAMLG